MNNLSSTFNDHCLQNIMITSPKLTTSTTCFSTPLASPKASHKMQHKQIAFPFKDNTQAATDIARIHSKITTKRVGGKVILIPRKQKKQEGKENRHERPTSRESGAPSYSRKLSFDEEDTNCIHIRSFLPSGEHPKNRHTRYRSDQMDQMQESIRGDYQVIQIFKEVKRKMELEKEYSKVFHRKQNCFFTSLKKRLQQEIKKTSQQTKRDKMNLLIQGCHAQQHIHEQHSRTACCSTRPVTPRKQAKTGRTVSCRPANRTSPVPSNSLQLVSQSRPARQTAKPTSQKTMKPSRNTSIRSTEPTGRNELDVKLSSILHKIEGQAKMSEMRVQMKTFEFYCRRLEEGFARANRKIDELQCLEID